MDKVKLSELLDKTTYVVKAFENEELYSVGSAFCFNKQGLLITAGHVITGRMPIREEDYKNENVRILARTKKGAFIEYKIVLCGITINWPNGPLKEPLQIDLAILRPVQPLVNAPFLEIEEKQQEVGTEILMAGFPDELELPLQWDQSFDYEYYKGKQSLEELKENMDRVRELLIMMKSGMIGFSDGLIIKPDKNDEWQLQTNVYYIDNVMHSGASGGPVIDENGKAIGVISKRAVTSVSYPDLENPKKEVPSGSALAISPYTIIDFLNHQIQNQQTKAAT